MNKQVFMINVINNHNNYSSEINEASSGDADNLQETTLPEVIDLVQKLLNRSLVDGN